MYDIYCKVRDAKGYKDADVARGTGITKSTFSDWKNGRSAPKQEKLEKIATFLGVSVTYLRTGAQPEENGLTDATLKAAFYADHMDALTADELDEMWDDVKAYAAFKLKQKLDKRRGAARGMTT